MGTGRYQLLKRIAAGGMGEVYLAQEETGEQPGRKVALKLLLPHLSDEPSFVAMFLDEARITAQLHHPNIPQVLDVGQADGRYYLAIELIEGVSASQLLRACRRAGAMLPLPLVRLIARGLCEALDYAHGLVDEQGKPLEIVHRDISPSNILVSAKGRVLLNDFGIARARGKSHASRTGEVKGKFAYMPPEQLAASGEVDRRADVYSAALTVFELATLESPFLRDTEASTIDAVRSSALPDVTLTRADASPSFGAALAQATARKPEQRPASAGALLEKLLDGPVGTPAELGQLVESLCANELAAFRKTLTEPITAAGLNTSSMRGKATPPLSDPGDATYAAAEKFRPSPLRWLLPVGILGAGLGAIYGWPDKAPATPVAVVEPKPEPKPEAKPEAKPEPTHVAVIPDAGRPPPSRPRPRPVEVAKPAAGPPGWLSVDATPWATVFLDGKEVGTTPLAGYPLPPGKYRLVFKNPGGKQAQRDVTVESGKSAALTVDLQ
jgi:eukaryotic-like serine/threonine-protein kinase